MNNHHTRPVAVRAIVEAPTLASASLTAAPLMRMYRARKTKRPSPTAMGVSGWLATKIGVTTRDIAVHIFLRGMSSIILRIMKRNPRYRGSSKAWGDA